jgi:hypothetical protein
MVWDRRRWGPLAEEKFAEGWQEIPGVADRGRKDVTTSRQRLMVEEAL